MTPPNVSTNGKSAKWRALPSLPWPPLRKRFGTAVLHWKKSTAHGSVLSFPAASAACPRSRKNTPAASSVALKKSVPILSPWPSAIWRRGRLPSVLACRACAAAPPPPVQAVPMRSAMRSTVSAMGTRTVCSAAAAKAASARWAWAALPA